MRRTTVPELILVTVSIWALVAAPANAYIDGGSTMVLFQWLVAGLAATWFGAKLFWSRIVGRFRRGDQAGTSDDDDSTMADTREA